MELLKKLRVKTDIPLWLINAPDNCHAYFDGLEVKSKLGKEKPMGQLVLFAYDSKELAGQLQRLTGYIAQDTLFWICYPKKSGAFASDLVLKESWDMVADSGYRTQTSVSIDNDWTGMRVTNAPPKKPTVYDVPIAERKSEGIDYASRTVTLPADAEAAMGKYDGLKDYFYSQSFTCQKEYVTAINDAKKEDTRRRRIEKIIEMLHGKMQAKQMKR